MSAPALGCPPLVPLCDAVGSVVGGVASDVVGGAIGQVAQGVYEAFLAMFAWCITLWLDFSPSPAFFINTAGDGFRSTVAWVASLLLVLLLLGQAIQVMWRRDGATLADAAAGVLKSVLVIGAGSSAVLLLWDLSDKLTQALAPTSQTIESTQAVALGTLIPGVTLWLQLLLMLLSVVGVFLSLGGILVMAFRTATVAILTLLLPIAAVGSVGGSTRPWLPKVTGWLLALIFLRPMVAAIYRLGLTWMAQGSSSEAALPDPSSGSWEGAADAADAVSGVVIGLMTMLVALFALPAMLRLFSWMFGGGPSGGGAGLAAGSLAATAGMARARGRAASQAASTSSDLGPSGGPPGPGLGGFGPMAAPSGSPGAAGPVSAAASGPSGSAGSAANGPVGIASVGAPSSAGAASAAAPAAAGGAAVAGGAAAAGPAGLAVAAAVQGGKQAVTKIADFSSKTAEKGMS